MTSNIEKNIMEFNHYEILINEYNKYGIIDSTGNQIIDCVFDNIEWFPDDNLIKFRLNNMSAVCFITDIERIK